MTGSRDPSEIELEQLLTRIEFDLTVEQKKHAGRPHVLSDEFATLEQIKTQLSMGAALSETAKLEIEDQLKDLINKINNAELEFNIPEPSLAAPAAPAPEIDMEEEEAPPAYESLAPINPRKVALLKEIEKFTHEGLKVIGQLAKNEEIDLIPLKLALHSITNGHLKLSADDLVHEIELFTQTPTEGKDLKDSMINFLDKVKTFEFTEAEFPAKKIQETFTKAVDKTTTPIPPPLAVKPEPAIAGLPLLKSEQLKKEFTQIIDQLEDLKTYIQDFPGVKKISDYGFLTRTLSNRIELLLTGSVHSDIKNQLFSIETALTNIHRKLDRLHRIPPKAGLVTGQDTSALAQFEKLCADALTNLKKRKDFMATDPNTEEEKFNLAEQRIKLNMPDASDKDVIAKISENYFGIPKPVSKCVITTELPAGSAPTQKLNVGEVIVCKVKTTNSDFIGYDKTRTENSAAATVTRVPDDLVPEKIWEKLYLPIFAKNDISEDSFKKVLQNAVTPYANDKEIKKNILNGLRQIGIPDDIAKEIYTNYQLGIDKMYAPGTNGLPCVDLAKLAMSMTDGLNEIIPNQTVVVRDAFSAANAKAMILYARSQGYEVENASRFKAVKVTDAEVAAFKQFMKQNKILGYHDIPQAQRDIKRAGEYQKKL